MLRHYLHFNGKASRFQLKKINEQLMSNRPCEPCETFWFERINFCYCFCFTEPPYCPFHMEKIDFQTWQLYRRKNSKLIDLNAGSRYFLIVILFPEIFSTIFVRNIFSCTPNNLHARFEDFIQSKVKFLHASTR